MILLSTLILIAFNFVNSRIDAYRILANKKIAHGINFGAYLTVVALCCWLFHMSVGQIILFSLSAFFLRQITFDVFLNLRRGLSAFYQSVANPPKAVMDRIERDLFGFINGKQLFIIYLTFFVVLFTISLFI